MHSLKKILFFHVLIICLSVPLLSLAEEELSPEQRTAKLEECLSYCNEDNICISNCEQAFSAESDEEEEEEENCD